MQVILPARAVPLPCRTAEHRLPVGRRRTVGLGIGPDVPVGLGIRAVLPAFAEPCVLVRCMRIHLVDDDFQAEAVSLGDDRVEIFESAEARVDAAIIGDVVSEILHRRGEEGRYPDTVDAQFGDVIEPFDDAAKVADPVGVGVAEAARVDLVDHRAAPPFVSRCGLGDRGHGGRHQSLLSNMQAAYPNAGNSMVIVPRARIAPGHVPTNGVTCDER